MALWRTVRLPLLLAVILSGGVFLPAWRNWVMETTAPLIQVTRRSGERLIDTLLLIGTIPQFARDNDRLGRRVGELEAALVESHELRHENNLLRQELELAESRAGTLVAAQVISRATTVGSQAVTINKGTNDGITKGLAMIAQGHLIGVVEEALPDTSRVTLITSPDSLLPVVMQNSRTVGLLKGGAEGLLVDELPRDIPFAKGEAVVSANIGDVIPSSIPVGTVSAVLSGKSDVFQSTRVASPIDFNRLEVIFGLK